VHPCMSAMTKLVKKLFYSDTDLKWAQLNLRRSKDVQEVSEFVVFCQKQNGKQVTLCACTMSCLCSAELG